MVKKDKLINQNNRFGVTSLGSGSKGNATLVRFENTLLLIDNGFSCKELVSRMKCRGIQPDDVTAIIVTHEHADHFNGVPAFSKKYSIPVWMNFGTSLHNNTKKIKDIKLFNSHEDFQIGALTICPVSVPHDSREACQFVFKQEQYKIGILTDIGHITPFVLEKYEGCHILLLEFNHEREILLNGAYPEKLKARVTGGLGHLCNFQASEFLNPLITKNLRMLVAMHLSQENNRIDLVQKSISSKKLPLVTQVLIAEQKTGFDWLYI